MSWLRQLFQADYLRKFAQWGDTTISFGSGNINSLKALVNGILSQPPQDQSRQYWVNRLRDSRNTALVLGNNGQALISVMAVQNVLFVLSSLTMERQELDRLRGELERIATQRQQQLKEKEDARRAGSLKVTSFRLMQATADFYTYALAWTSHNPEKQWGFLWDGSAPNLANPIKDAIEQRLGVKLNRDRKNIPKEWLVAGLTPENIPQLKQIFAEFSYDTSLIDAAMQNTEQQTSRTSKFLIQFENVSGQSDYHLSANLKQFAGREKDLLPTFLDIVDKVFTVKGAAPKAVQNEAPAPGSVPVTAQISDRLRENIANKREQFIQPAGEYYAQGNSTIFLRGSFAIYQDFQKMLAMKRFDTADLIAKALHKGSELRNSGHVKLHRLVNGVVDGYWKARANRQRLKDPLGLYLPNDEAFQKEVQGYAVKKSGEEPYRLYPAQGQGVQWLYSRQSALLGDETGVGKTEQLIIAADMRTKQQNSLGETNLWDSKMATGKILIFTLASVVNQFAIRILQVLGLPEESLNQPGCPVKLSIEEMNQPEAKWLVLSYGAVNVLNQAQQEGQMGDTEEADDAIEVVDPTMSGTKSQRENRVAALMQQIRLQNFDVMIMDECHMVKNSTSNTSKNIEQLGSTIPFKWGASATVSANKPLDLHRQLLATGNPMGFMDRRRFSKKYTGMSAKKVQGTDKEYYADPSSARDFLNIAREEHRGFDDLDLAGKSSIVLQLANDMLRPIVDQQIKSVTDLHAMLILTDVYRRKTKKQVKPDIPEHTRNPEMLATTPEDRQLLSENVQQHLENMRADGKDADSPLTRLTAYRIQMALQKVPQTANKAASIIAQGQKVLVFTCFQESATKLEESLRAILQPNGMEVFMTMGEGTGTAMKTNMIDQFRDPNSPIKAFVLGVLSSGTGLDLPNIVNNVIVNDISWTPKDADQVEGRAFRVNSKSPVTTHYMVLADTPDSVIYQTVQKKRDIAQRIQNIDEQYAEKVRQNASTDKELAAAQEQHWALVKEQLIAETTVQHYWAEQQKMMDRPRRVAQTWLQRLQCSESKHARFQFKN